MAQEGKLLARNHKNGDSPKPHNSILLARELVYILTRVWGS
jgi:hypothetical protein